MFDLEKESSLYIDFAKSNSRSKRWRTGLQFALPRIHLYSFTFPY